MTTETPQLHRSEELVQQVVEIIETARGVPMSASVMINRDEVLDLLDSVLSGLPDELRAARWLLKERDDFRQKAHHEAEEIIADAKSHVARMVQRTEVVKAAEQRAHHIIEDAEAEARRMTREAEDYCDQKLASFEVDLERLQKIVQAGRRKLAATIEESELGTPSGVYADEEGSDAEAFFDQDSE